MERWEQFKDGDIIAYTDEYLVIYLIFKRWINKEEVDYYYWSVRWIGADCKLMPFSYYAKRSHPAALADLTKFKRDLTTGLRDPIPWKDIKDYFKMAKQTWNRPFEYKENDFLICDRTGDMFQLKRFRSPDAVDFHKCVNFWERKVLGNGSLIFPKMKDCLRFASIDDMMKYKHIIINQ